MYLSELTITTCPQLEESIKVSTFKSGNKVLSNVCVNHSGDSSYALISVELEVFEAIVDHIKSAALLGDK